MALIFLDSSPCSLCGNILHEGDDIISWQAFLNEGHKFWEYSDSGMHRACFEKWEYKNEFEELYKYQPCVDFNDPWLKKQIEEHGMPDWLKQIKEYREHKAKK